MAVVDLKHVYQNGADIGSILPAYKLADTAAELSGGVEGDLGYAKDTDKVYRYNGSSWAEVGPYTPPAAVTFTSGTWTPILTGSSGASGQSYSVQTGGYWKIQNLVLISGIIKLTNKGTISGSQVAISGLPFSAQPITGLDYSGNVSYWAALNTSWAQMGIIFSSGTVMYLYGAKAGAVASTVALANADISNTTEFRFNCFYQTY